MIGLTLRIFDSLGWVLDRAGVDRMAFRAILEVKLLQDQRRTISGFQQVRTRSPKGAFRVSLAMFAFMGTFLGLGTFWFDSILVALTIVNSMYMLVMGFMLIADFTHVLVDTADNSILLPRPVSDRTLLAARTAHIVHYLGLLSLAFCGATLVGGTIRCGVLFLPLYLVTMALSLLLVVFLVCIFYFLALKRTDLERFRDIILYFQVIMTILFFGGYQLLPRLILPSVLEGVSIEDVRWIYIFPPAWMAAPADMLDGNVGVTQMLLTTLAVSVPLACFAVVIRFLAPGFTRALAAMDSSAAGREKRRSGEGDSRLARFWSRWLTADGEERAAFDMLWSVAARDRALKLATYPTVGMIFIMMTVFLIGDRHESLREKLAEMSGDWMVLFMLYFGCVLGPTVLLAMRFSDQHEACWICRALPIGRPGSVLLAAFKVALLRYAAPVFTVISILVVALCGPRVLVDIALAGAGMVLISILYVTVPSPSLPFSLPRSAQSSGQGAGVLLFTVLLGFLGLGHYLLGLLPLGKPILTVLLAAAAWRLVRRCGRITWNRLLWGEPAG